MRHLRMLPVALDNLPAAVGRAVVEQNQFEIRKRLGKNTVDTLRQIRSVVEVRHNHAHGRPDGRTASLNIISGFDV